MRLGKYDGLKRFLGRQDYYVYDDYTIVRLNGRDDDASFRGTVEVKKLLHLHKELDFVPSPYDLGFDERYGDFYVLKVDDVLDSDDLFHHISVEGPRMAKELVRCLADLHARGFVYRNVRPDAIGLTRSKELVLFDFSLSQRFGDDRMVKALRKRTRYDAHETQENEYDGVRADIYSVGMLLKDKCLSLLVDERVANLVQVLVSPEPRHRPSSMERTLSLIEDIF